MNKDYAIKKKIEKKKNKGKSKSSEKYRMILSALI